MKQNSPSSTPEVVDLSDEYGRAPIRTDGGNGDRFDRDDFEHVARAYALLARVEGMQGHDSAHALREGREALANLLLMNTSVLLPDCLHEKTDA